MIYFLSDTHFSHDREFIWKNRGFNSIQEHDETIIKNFNSLVKPNDTVYFLGDFTWGDPVVYFKQLNGNNWHFIHGNHDNNLYQALKSTGRLKSYSHGYSDIVIDKVKFTLSHFPMLSWEKSHWGAILLYGHLHGRAIPIQGKMLDVGIDNIKNYPISLDEVLEIAKSLPDNWDFVNKGR